MTEEQIAIEKENSKLVADAKEEATRIIDKAKEIRTEADKRKATRSIKESELDELQRQTKHLKKSNQGKERHLSVENEETQKLKAQVQQILK